MFKNRKIVVTMDKVNNDQIPATPVDPEAFEKKTEIVLRKLERAGAKVFLGVCVYVMLDTHRSVAIVKATNKTYR